MVDTKKNGVDKQNVKIFTRTARRRRRLQGTKNAKGSSKRVLRSRESRPFPAASFEESLSFAHEIFVVGSGQPVRRLTLFDHLKKAPESGASRMLIVNRFVGLLKTLSGADRIVSVDYSVDNIPAIGVTAVDAPLTEGSRGMITQETAAFETTCFYITPIGDDTSEARKHSDLFLGSIIEPALSTFNLKVVRADNIAEPGVITRQIIEHLLRSRLVIADLSFHNPNVFYELALRHAVRLPIVQIIRAGERIPFDVHQMRTVVIDNRDIYSLVPKLETYRSEIATQVRSALEAKAEVDTPISVHFPHFKVTT